MTAALNLPDGASLPAAVFRALAGVRDAMADGTYGYGGDDNGDVVVVGRGRVHPAVRIETKYLGPDPDPDKREGGGSDASGREGDAGGEASPDGGGDGSSLSASAAAGGGAALLATGGSLLVLSFVLRWGGGRGGNALESPSAGGAAVWYRRPPAARCHVELPEDEDSGSTLYVVTPPPRSL